MQTEPSHDSKIHQYAQAQLIWNFNSYVYLIIENKLQKFT